LAWYVVANAIPANHKPPICPQPPPVRRLQPREAEELRIES
jgi:hypothetical protein